MLPGSVRVTEFEIMQYIEYSELNAPSGCDSGHGGFALVSTCVLLSASASFR